MYPQQQQHHAPPYITDMQQQQQQQPYYSANPYWSYPVTSDSAIHPPGTDPFGNSATPFPVAAYGDQTTDSQNWIVKQSDPIKYDHAVGSSHETSAATTSLPSTWNATWPQQYFTSDATAMRCEVCKIDCNSKDVYEKHISGKKHQRNLQLSQVPYYAAYNPQQYATYFPDQPHLQFQPEPASVHPHGVNPTPPEPAQPRPNHAPTGSSQYRGRGGRPFRRGGRGRGRGVGGGRHFPSHSSGPATSDVSGASASAGATLVVQSSSSVPKPAQVPTAPRKVYCEICKVECNTPEIMEQHKNGKKHKKNMKVHEILQRQNATNGQQSGQIPTSQMNSTDQPKKVDESEGGKCPTKNMSSEITVDNQKDEMKLQNNVGETSEVPAEEPKGITMDNSAPRGRGLKRKMRGGKGAKRMRINDGSKAVQVPKPEQDISFTCELCNVKCESHVVYQSHLTGKKHLSKLRHAHGHQASSEAVGLGLQAHYPPDINALANAINAQVQQGDNDPQVLLAQLLMNVLSQAQASATAPMNGPLPAAQTPTPTSVAGSSYEPQLLQTQVSEITAHVEMEKNPTRESENDMLSVPLQLNAQEGSGVSTQIVEGECSETK